MKLVIIVSKQTFPLHLRLAIWYANGKKSGYEDIPINYAEMEIDHIIPERILLNPKEPKEFELWTEKYDLEDGFDIHGIQNLCPSTRKFNLNKHDKGLYDEADAYGKFIVKALIRAKELTPKIEELSKKFKKELDLRNAKLSARVQKAVIEGEINIRKLVLGGLKVNIDELEELGELQKYDNILNKYKAEGISLYNFGEYFEMKSAIRYSFNKKGEDIDFWLNLFNDFILKTEDNMLKKRLLYEKAYAMFKTDRTWIPIEVDILEYLRSAVKEKNLEILNRTSILFNIYYGEFQRNRVNSSIDTIIEIRGILLKILSLNIKNSKTNMRKANLEYSKFLIEGSHTREEYQLISDEDDVSALKSWISRYYQGLTRLIDIIKNVNFFDFNEFYSTFTRFSEGFPIIKEHPDFDNVYSRIVDLKNKYEGKNSTISDLMKRGIELYEKKNYTRAIKQFHKIKSLSFNPENFYTCLSSIYYIGECYNKMGLHYAAKYYFMVVFHFANEMDVEYNIKQLSYDCGTDRIAMVNYNLNHTLEGMYFSSLSLILREFYSIDEFTKPSNRNSNLIGLIWNMLISYAYSQQTSGNLHKIVSKFLSDSDLLNFIELINKQISAYTNYELIKELGIFFKDTEKVKRYSWNQLDIIWKVKWDNNFITSSLSEEFIAYLQVFLSSLEDIDILIVNDDMEIELKLADNFHVTEVNGVSIIEIPRDKVSDYFLQFFSFILEILTDKMIISIEQVMNEIKPLFEVGYFSNFYDEIYKSLIRTDLFDLTEQFKGDDVNEVK